jgi:high affinity Mn2+ porin
MIRSEKHYRRALTAATFFAMFACAMPAVGQQTPVPVAANDVQNPAPEATATPVPEERWNLFWQATSIGQYHGTFNSPYQGPNSLQDATERDVSLTTTLFLGLRLTGSTQLYVDPEIAGGRGFSGVTGIADFPNGEMPRVSTAMPKPYLARAYLVQDFGFGGSKESVDSDENQLAGERPVNRYTIVLGRFAASDFFDNNSYSHDPRSQFMGWAAMYNGAWDYPADTRGYTWGWVHELHTKNWAWRYGSCAEPKVANGASFDRRLFRDRGDMFETERRYTVAGHAGAIRALGFLLHTDSGTYSEALRLAAATGQMPDVTLTHRAGTLKYGAGVSFEQEIARGIGVFSRLGWNDGKTESFVFTAMDRLASGGVSVSGGRWKRKYDTAASALIVGGISGVHAQYLAHGGLDFLIGDARLRYAPEYVWESYYSARLFPGFFATFDLQHITNPAYNQDRGPLWASSIRLHIELGKASFAKSH